MKLTDRQMEAMAQRRLSHFSQRVARFMRRRYGRQVANLDDATLLRQVAAGLAHAQRYGFKRQDSLATFAALSILYAPDFDRHPAVSAILRKTRIPDHRRLDLLEHRITPEQWRQARRRVQPIRESAGRP